MKRAAAAGDNRTAAERLRPVRCDLARSNGVIGLCLPRNRAARLVNVSMRPYDATQRRQIGLPVPTEPTALARSLAPIGPHA